MDDASEKQDAIFSHLRVRVVAGWSSFLGQSGAVVSREPYLMVLLEGETQPMRFGDTEVERA